VFPADDVAITDHSSRAAHFRLAGPRAAALLARALALPGAAALPAAGKCATFSLAGADGPAIEQDADVLVVHGAGLAPRAGDPGYTLLAAPRAAPALWAALAGGGGSPEDAPVLAGADAWEALRILDGVPAAAAELTEEHNPLEAGLWSAVSFDKARPPPPATPPGLAAPRLFE